MKAIRLFSPEYVMGTLIWVYYELLCESLGRKTWEKGQNVTNTQQTEKIERMNRDIAGKMALTQESARLREQNGRFRMSKKAIYRCKSNT